MHTIPRPTTVVAAAFAAALLMLTLGASTASAAGPHTGFGFNARDISGFPSGAVTLTGGGAFDPSTGFVHSGGSFSCEATVNQGPLTGCMAGQGVRWDTAELLPGTMFKCSGAAAETLKPASTGAGEVVLHADFYRAGDGNDESFTANMIVADHDIAPDIAGVQNAWVQGVGCTNANAHFSA